MKIISLVVMIVSVCGLYIPRKQYKSKQLRLMRPRYKIRTGQRILSFSELFDTVQQAQIEVNAKRTRSMNLFNRLKAKVDSFA